MALAAIADQFSRSHTDKMSGAAAAGIHPAFYYALFRAGLPANSDTLYQADPQTVQQVWKRATEEGVIPNALQNELPTALQAFQRLSAEVADRSGAGGCFVAEGDAHCIRLDDDQQQRFALLYTAKRADLPTFWKAVGDTFGKDIANRLQLDGKLGFLTINNAPLMQQIHNAAGANGLSDPLQLAQLGYHREAKWSSLLTPNLPIPKEIPGETLEVKQANYADYLAPGPLSYPTAAVAEMVKSGDLPLTGAAQGVPDQVHTFLTDHQGKFEIGVQPVQQYIARNNLQVADETVEQVKRLQRVYQITPSDGAMIGLMKRGIDAAYHVVRFDKDTFVQSFAADLGEADQAALVHDRSVLVHGTILNITLSYLTARTAPPIGVHSPPSILDPTPANTGDVVATANLETIFGSMDFCACDHCRSI